MLYDCHIHSFLEVGNDLDDFFGDTIAHVREVLACSDGLEEGEKLIAQALAIQLVEVAFVVLWVLVSHLEVICLPPWGWNIDVSLGARDDELAF